MAYDPDSIDEWIQYPHGYGWDICVGLLDVLFVVATTASVWMAASAARQAAMNPSAFPPPTTAMNTGPIVLFAGCLAVPAIGIATQIVVSKKWAFITMLVFSAIALAADIGGSDRGSRTTIQAAVFLLSVARILYYSLRLGTAFGPPLR